MNIELDETTKRLVIEQAKRQLLSEVLAQFNSKQIAAEIKNLVVKEAAATLSKQFANTYKTNEVVERAVQSAESRVQSQVTKLLEKGITIKFKGEPND